jgi:hypothetical protein
MLTVTKAGAQSIKWTLRSASAEFGVLIPTWLASCCDRRQQLNTVKLIVRL